MQSRSRPDPTAAPALRGTPGFSYSSSEFALFLDADDYLRTGFLQALLPEICKKKWELIVVPLIVEHNGKLILHDHFHNIHTNSEWLQHILNGLSPQTGQVVSYLLSFELSVAGTMLLNVGKMSRFA